MNTHALQTSLREALADEYKARALYRKVIQAFGPVRPFVHIVEAEQRHIEALLPLFEHYGIPVPVDDWGQRVETPESPLEACRLGVEAEIANVAMYDHLLAAVEAPDVRNVFLHLQAASRDRHLPAFQRCVARGGKVGRGAGFGGGRGRGGRHGAQGCWSTAQSGRVAIRVLARASVTDPN